MDSDLLRLILIALGIVLAVAIYLWDRHKRIAKRFSRINPAGEAREQPTFDMPEEAIVEEKHAHKDPQFQFDDSASLTEQSLEEVSEVKLRPGQAIDVDADSPNLTGWDASEPDSDPKYTLDLNFSAHGETDYLSTDPALQDNVPRQILQINLVSKKNLFSGAAILEAMKEVDMRHGDMAIYHRLDSSSGKVLFSIASMVEPGTFPTDGMEDFESPGLSMFTQLPGIRDGLAIYSDMLFTAERLSALLDAELQDGSHSVLTRQTIEHTREEILEHRRQVRLARSQH